MFFAYQKSLNLAFVCVVNSQQLLCSQKWVLNVGRKVFWHTKIIELFEICQMHVLELKINNILNVLQSQ